jgi:ABC-2 type transport system ATP-binding protein
MTTTGAAIQARDLTKTYGKDVRALDGLGFSVGAGTVFGLLGPNGAGKSTTVKVLTTLSLPDSGSARVAGVDVLAEPDRVRRSIGLVGQRSGVDLEATGRENLTLQGQVYGLRGAELRSRVGELLERFGLAEAADRVARGYSGGMQRRLDIAMGLIHRPRVLFLDEPTTGLDPEVRAGMWAEIAHLSAAEGLTILLTTHYLEEADRLAGRLAIVDRGRVVAEAARTSSRASCAATPSTSSWVTPRPTAGPPPPWTACPASGRWRWTAAPCGPGPATARRPSRPSSRPWRPAGSGSPR